MARHEIPTHLGVEDKLFGPLTARDALYLLVGASAAYGLWTNETLPSWARAILAGAVSLVALLLGLVKIRGRPLEGWLFAGLIYAGRPRRTVWSPRPARQGRVHHAPGVHVHPYKLRMRWRAHPSTSRRSSGAR